MRNYVANAIYEVLADNIGTACAEEKMLEMKNMNKYESLAWCIKLDGDNLESLAKKLDASADELRIAIKVLNQNV
ncbi:hypothetical protein ACQEXU_18815 [Vibrio sp. TRT 21S02]|uniref:hypothetical protein n=1 Tax=Vibrio sp. TRT 21S02 TaxID=3418507 RepID=UPI003CE9D1EE